MAAVMPAQPGQVPLSQQFFTTRVGTQVINHQQPDSLALRNWAQIKEDPRSRFKESYGPTNRIQPAQQRSGRAATDGIVNAQVEQLQLELSQARSEIQQLRQALHYAGLALQGVGSWDKLPPELRCHLDAHQRMVDELTNNLRSRDEEVLRLTAENSQSKKLLSHHRHVLLESMACAFGNGPLLLAWSGWLKLMRQKHRDNDFLKALQQSKTAMRPRVERMLKDWQGKQIEGLFGLILSNWFSLVRAEKMEAALKKHTEDGIARVVQLWNGGQRTFALNLAFRGWSEISMATKAAQGEDLRRKHHLEDEKRNKKEAHLKMMMAMTSSSDGKFQREMEPVILMMVIRAWRSDMLDSKATKAILQEQEDAKALKARMIERHFLLLLSDDRKANLGLVLRAWQDFTQRAVVVNLTKLMSKVFHAWDTATKTGHRARELEKTRKHLKDTQSKRHAVLLLFTSDKQTQLEKEILLRMTMRAWVEEYVETKNQERWMTDWTDQQKKLEDSSRARRAALAMTISKPADEQSNYMLLHIVWKVWKDDYEAARRDRDMDGAQRVFEDDLRKAQREKEELEKEMKNLDKRYHAQNEQRKQKLMTKGWLDEKSLKQIVWSAWLECVVDANEEVARMAKEVKEHVPNLVESLKEVIEEDIHPLDSYIHKQGCLHRCCWFCCPCCKPKHIPEHPPHQKPGCLRRLLWCCCPCCRPRHHVSPLEAHRVAQHKWEEDLAYGNEKGQGRQERRSPGTAQRAFAESPPSGKLTRASNFPSRREQHRWRLMAVVWMTLYTLLTLGAIAGNVFVMIVDSEDLPSIIRECDRPWWQILLGNICLAAVALISRFWWLVGGMLMANGHLVKAGQFAKRTSSGDDQADNYQRELRMGHASKDTGFRLSCLSNNCLDFICGLSVAWCVVGWVTFGRSGEGCDAMKQWWPGIFGGMAFWVIVTLIMRWTQTPLI